MIFNNIQKIYVGNTEINKVILQNSEVFSSVTYNAVIVSGAGISEVNQTYIQFGKLNGRDRYKFDVDGHGLAAEIFYNFNRWNIYEDRTIGDIVYYTSDNVMFPWQGTWQGSEYDNTPPILTPTNI
jgi:hypothetical protein